MSCLADLLSQWRRHHPRPRYGFFLGAAAVNEKNVYFSAGEPSHIWHIRSMRDLLAFEKRVSRRTSLSGGDAMPRFVGYFGFEAGRLFDPALARTPMPAHPLKTPYGIWGEYPAVIKASLVLNQTARPPASIRPAPVAARDRKRFVSMVKKAKRHIAAGDIYQANLSLRFSKRISSSPVELYQKLSVLNPSPYACLLMFPGASVVSASPELLCEVRGRRVATRPIAGTRPRGASPAQDQKRQGQLLLSPKERAEHIMLVDLERNDLGRVCRPGSVHVGERFSVERYSHVMHIVSQVEGRLRRNVTALQAFKSLFPGGTITGCPKIKSVEIIETLEALSRGPFYGSAGYIAGSGDAVFNILIRTAYVQKSIMTFQAGAGIVADSNPAREYHEVLAKAGALFEVAK